MVAAPAPAPATAAVEVFETATELNPRARLSDAVKLDWPLALVLTPACVIVV